VSCHSFGDVAVRRQKSFLAIFYSRYPGDGVVGWPYTRQLDK